jgi:hypothetical protein
MVTGNDATRNDPCSILKTIVMGSNVITGECLQPHVLAVSGKLRD